jgi:aryl-alcohol dehydrogenase-like predicted oxidoreductase
MIATLPTRRLGNSDLHLSTVGFGAWAAGGGGWAYGWGPQDDTASIDSIRYAVERGINWIDTAAVYGLGHSEEVVRRALQDIPPASRPHVFTKCGLVWNESNPEEAPRQVLEPASIRRECEASLRRLGVETIDLYQFHWPDQTGTAVEDSWATMSKLVDEGKVRWAGVSNFDIDLMRRCEAVRHVDSLQPPLSLIRRQAAEAEISRRHRVQSTSIGASDRAILARTRHIARARRLAPPVSRLQAAEAGPQSGTEGCTAADRWPVRHHGERRGYRLDSGVAGRHRRDRGGALPRAGRRLDRRGDTGADPG